MRRKALSLLLTVALCLALTVPASAAAYEYDNGKCVYELSNAPIGTVEIGEPTLETTTTVLVVPDKTTVISKTVPDGRMISYAYIFNEGGDSIDWNMVGGEPFVVEPFFNEDDTSILVSKVWSEDFATGTEEIPQALDFDEGGVPVMAQSAAEAAGLTVQPLSDASAETEPAAPAEPDEATVPDTSTPAAPAFTDVAAGSAFAPAISWAVEKGITTGLTSTTFGPGEQCNNGQILTFLWRASGSPESTIDNPFQDAIPNSFQKAAVWASEKGLVTGSTFGSATPCTRSMVVTYLWQLAGSPEVSGSADFPDVAADAAYAQAVAWAVEKGITTGKTDGSFAPDEVCTRGQIVTFIYRDLGE